MTITNFDVVLIGQSNTIAELTHSCSSCCSFRPETTVGSDEKYCNRLKHSNEEQQSSSTENAGCIDVESPMPLIGKQGYLDGQHCERVMKKLEYLQDNGRFEKHEHLVTSCLQLCAEKGNADMRLALQLEQGVAYSYHKDFKKSKGLFVSVIKFDNRSQLKNPNILYARAYFLLVADLRSKKVKKIPAMLECLRRSQFYLQNHDSPEDWAELYYNYGSVWLAYMGMMSEAERSAQARRDAREKARNYYEMAISACKRDTRLRVQTKQQTYIHLKVAALLLDCSSTTARCQQKRIPPQDIEEVKRHLDFVENELGPSIPFGTRVQLLKTRSDQFYRQGLYQLAKETADQGLKIAVQHEFYTELDALQERIDFIGRFCEQRIKVLGERDTTSSDTHSNNESD